MVLAVVHLFVRRWSLVSGENKIRDNGTASSQQPAQKKARKRKRESLTNLLTSAQKHKIESVL